MDSLEGLAKRARRGDRDAFASIVEQAGPVLFRYLSGELRNRELAEEAYQETWARAVRSLRLYRGEASFTTWLIAIGRRVAGDLQRHRDRDGAPVGDAIYRLAEPTESASYRGQRRSVTYELVEVVEAIDSLPKDLREALLLTRVAGLTYSEVAEILGTKEGTVKSRVFRARKAIVQACYGAEEAEVEGGLSDV